MTFKVTCMAMKAKSLDPRLRGDDEQSFREDDKQSFREDDKQSLRRDDEQHLCVNDGRTA